MLRHIFVAACAVAQCLLGVSAAAGSAVSDANITGHVVDAETGEHMPFYYVKVLDTKLATLTDASGHYVFRDLTPGDYTLEASFTGYKTAWRLKHLWQATGSYRWTKQYHGPPAS